MTIDHFLEWSSVLTGFSQAELLGTGRVAEYFDEFVSVLGMAAFDRALTDAPSDPARSLSCPFSGPVLRNVIRIWYTGRWLRLPDSWRAASTPAEAEEYDRFQRDVDRVVSAAAYREGLAWRAIGVNPPGAKQPGYASWSLPPSLVRSEA